MQDFFSVCENDKLNSVQGFVMSEDTKSFLKFAALDFLFWAFFASFIGFITTYFLDCGMSSSMVSIVLAVYMMFAFGGAFFWGGLSDKMRSNKKVFIPELILLTAVGILEFYLTRINIWFGAVLHPLAGFLAAPLGTNLDAWMLKTFSRDAGTFGRARALGSAGYAVMMLSCGTLYNTFGFGLIPFVMGILFVLIMILAVLTKEQGTVEVKRAKSSGNMKGLLKIRPYVFLIIVLFLTGLAVSPINNLKIVILQSVGGDVSMLGLDSFIGVMVQALFIFISGSLKRIPVYLRMVFMTALSMLMVLFVWLAVSPFMVILGTVMANISYGFMLPTMREITEGNVPQELKNTAHSLTDAMFGSFAGVIALLYSGTLMDLYGAKFVAFLGLLIMIIPTTMCVISYMRSLGKKNA